jgi:hypothetical protein
MSSSAILGTAPTLIAAGVTFNGSPGPNLSHNGGADTKWLRGSIPWTETEQGEGGSPGEKSTAAASATSPPCDDNRDQMVSWIDPRIEISLFSTAHPNGLALGTRQRMTWKAIVAVCRHRRQGDKDGRCFCPSAFAPEPDGRVRRQNKNLIARTLITLDIETNEKTGEVPPPLAEAVKRVAAKGWKAIIYTSHRHTADLPRYRIVMPLTREIEPDIPAVEAIADLLDLAGVLDRSKCGGSALFYLPSCEPGHLALHETVEVKGESIWAAWMREKAGAIRACREAERELQHAVAMEAAAKRREKQIARGFAPDASIIAAVRDRLNLEEELIGHGYEPAGGGRYLYPASTTGAPGVHILTGWDGVERVYSHHAADPLAGGNLPLWCKVKAIDVVDVVTILDFGGDRKRALGTLAKRFGIDAARSKCPAGINPPPRLSAAQIATDGVWLPETAALAPPKTTKINSLSNTGLSRHNVTTFE